MKSIIDVVRLDSHAPFVGRAAARSMVGSLNFTIANLVASKVRQRRVAGVPAEDDRLQPATRASLEALQEKYGNTLDIRSEIDEHDRGQAHEDRIREEQGFVVVQDPMELAGLLKVVRDALAEDLLLHAQMLRNPLDPKGGTYADPFHVAPSLEESFLKQLANQPKVNEAQATAQARALELDPADVIRVLQRQQEVGLRFLKENKEELLALINEVGARKPDGGVYSTEDAAEVEAKLPGIHRARLFVSADRGLWYETDRTINMRLRGHPDALGNLKLLDGKREEVHALFKQLMQNGNVHRDIDEAVRRGATWPALLPLRKRVSELAAEAKAA